MAEALIRQRSQRRGVTGVVNVSSAGTWAEEGIGATKHAATVMRERGIVLDGHRSREVDAGQVSDADLILVMTASHREAIIADFPDAKPKTLLMSTLAGGEWDIADPIGGTLDDYRSTARELERLIDAGWQTIGGAAGGSNGEP